MGAPPTVGPADLGRPEPSPPSQTRDSDGDGITDQAEVATGTSPLDPDTDGDGVEDGVEDANRDGRVDEGESDPRVPGLHPGSSPHLPEPMDFDLVRGLGAKGGEVEANVLVNGHFRGGRWTTTTWAPEVEWAIVDGFAVELELPMRDTELEALKFAAQWTAPSWSESVAHGLQGIVETELGQSAWEGTLLYLVGTRVGRAVLFAMVGWRGHFAAELEHQLLVNPSFFVDAHEVVTLGIEGQAAFGQDGRRSGRALAQIHWQVSRRFRIQLGGGVERVDGETGGVLASRLILE
jgi:hypothetical protein